MRKCLIYLLVFIATCFRPVTLQAVLVSIPTPGGVLFLNLAHAGPSGQLVEPEPSGSEGFRPPTIFAAPLPTGSGARALGQAGAFTAVADDATAASWNPAGLTQLERAEMSVVYRFSEREDTHHSDTRDLVADRDTYNSNELNYLSAVYPFLFGDRNAVFSMNYQESYDFTQVFTASFQGDSDQRQLSTTNQTFQETSVNFFKDAIINVAVTSQVTTVTSSRIDQLLQSSLLTDIDFVQQGTIDAISPAFAVELSPELSVGATLNFYTDGGARGNPIESSLRANYSGTSDSVADITDSRDSTATGTWGGKMIGGDRLDPVITPISGVVGPVPFSETNVTTQVDRYRVDGSYYEKNTTDQFYGANATLGALWSASDRLTLGVSVDLPWTGYGTQTKRTRHQVTTMDSNQVQVAQSIVSEMQERDVEYTFPLYAAVGGAWRWNDRLTTSMDVSQTCWSDYSYQADGEERISPVSGESYSGSALDDCWSARLGNEYLYVLSWTEIPLRGGLFWEQRPAVGSPDEYMGFTLGSGISLGKDPGRVILDIAYIYERGEDVMSSLLPEQAMSSDVNNHKLFVSAIWHF